MKELVEVKGKEVFCTSMEVSARFGIQHIRVLATIDKLTAEYSKVKGCTDAPLNFQKEDREYRGQSFTIVLMDKRSFSILAMRFSGSKALEWQVHFVDAFSLMEKKIALEEYNKSNLDWNKSRQQGITARKEETDVIKEFVNYATAQGSTGAQFYYKHITMACYKCLQLMESKKPKLRDILSVMELNQLMLAEVVAGRSIKRHMEEGEHYKAIFELVKQDLERFAGSLMIGSAKMIE